MSIWIVSGISAYLILGTLFLVALARAAGKRAPKPGEDGGQ